jgi:hypothetical protein
MTRGEAAAYCRLSPNAFSQWVRLGRLPAAIPNTGRWDLKSIDLAIDRLSGLSLECPNSSLDDWREERARRSERNS